VAHSLSAKKRVRQNERRRMLNRVRRGAMRTQLKKCTALIEQGGEAASLEQEVRQTKKQIDQLAAKGVMHKNTAARRKSQLARKLNAAIA